MMSWLARMLSMLLAAVCEQREFRAGHMRRGNGYNPHTSSELGTTIFIKENCGSSVELA